jgi:transcriptional regulator with XRE-family HTH domain
MRNPVDLHIGQRVRHRRWLQGMTQQQLAEAVGIRFQQVQKYESGANRISAARLWDLARALDIGVPFFYGGLSGKSDDSDDAALGQKEAIDLVRSYYAIAEGPRARFLELVKAIANQEPREVGDANQAPHAS